MVEFASKHYAHARDHEHLRAQVTAILSAAAFVLVGFALGDDASDRAKIAAGIFSAVLGLLNLRLNSLQENRFEAHVAAASYALNGLEKSLPMLDGVPSLSECRDEFKRIKCGGLSQKWAYVPLAVVVAGLLLMISGILGVR